MNIETKAYKKVKESRDESHETHNKLLFSRPHKKGKSFWRI